MFLNAIMKRRCQPDLIHINELPEDLIKKILVLLPVKDAVRTSVLSRKWRYVWTELPELVFDDRFCEGLIMKKKSKIIMTIFHVLLFHTGPLDLFELSLSNLKSCPEIDQIVLIVLKAGIKDITLHIPKGEPYRSPSSIFAYGQQLESLDLRSCVFKPPTGFNGFSKLTVLVLKEVGIDGSAFSSLISYSPLLEYLRFVSYTNCGPLDISAPNLEYFSFVGLCESLSFTSTPKLATVSIFRYDYNHEYRRREPQSQCMLSGRLPFVEKVTLDEIYSKHVTANRATTSLVNDFYLLEKLYLHIGFGFLDEVSSVLCLVKNSNNLEKLKINAFRGETTSNVKFKEGEGFLDVTLDHLRTFKLVGVSGSKCELQFIELVLAKSPVLKKCHIITNSELGWEKRTRFFKELLRFQRTWPLVEIAYEDSDGN